MRRHHRHHFQYLSLALICLGLLGVMVALRRNLSQSQLLFGRAAPQPANIIVDTQTSVDFLTRPWRSLAQGGESPTYQFAPITGELAAIKPEYIRLDHVFDFYDVVTRNQEGALTYQWAKLDLLLNQITAVGATPFISLSYMPPTLNPDDVTGKPTNWSEWQALVKATIEHISGVSGLNLKNVYYEVWNEPDLFGNWKTYGNKNYLTLYDYAARGAAAAQNTNFFFFGGPATTALYDNWTNKLFEYVAQNNLRLDFYSWHNYSSQVETYSQDVLHYYDLARQYPQFASVEPLISEWGFDSNNHSGYDTSLSAAHTVSVVTQLIPTLRHAFIFEIQDGKDPAGNEYWGRWGLLTHGDFGSHKKSRYQALALLNRLSSDQLSLVGQGDYVKGLATRAPDGTTQILLSNYDIEGRYTETIPITFINLNPGTYRLTTEFLDRLPTSTLVSATTPTLIHNVAMPPNSVVLLELSRQ